MKLIKVLSLAALCVAAMAFLGAGSALGAAHEDYGLCKKQELLLCEELIPVASGQLLGKATSPVLEGTLAEKCSSSVAEGKVTGKLDELVQLQTQIDSLTFTNCSPCETVTVENLPLAAELKMATVGGSDWTFISKGVVNMTNCIFGMNCKFGSEKFTFLVEMTEAGAVLNTNKSELQFKGGSEFFCGKTGKWNAKYALTWTLTADGKEDTVFPTLLGRSQEDYGLCKKQELLLCKDLIKVDSGQLLGQAFNPVLEGTLAEKCSSSMAKGKITGKLDELGQLKGQIDSLTFTGCSPCSTVTVEVTPLAAEVKMATVGGSDWTFITKGVVNMTNCVFGISCKFGSEKFTFLVEMTEAGAVLNTNKSELQFKGGSEFFCGKTGKWNAKYALTWTLTADGKEDLVFPTLLGTA